MKVVIIGAGGHGRVVLDIMLHAGGHEVVGFLDSDAGLYGRRMDGVIDLERGSVIIEASDQGKCCTILWIK